ncbi:hypothetical protein [Pseudarthrobacter sp. C1]|uniref:hypothetical protein n=1 Tax=Pseudarthrobacter sp. C1 TaxID=3108940 RepID=UPI002B056266|nr:hypothetical protein [Pseudarthrobacter sp. C1]MEA3550260.1 hypothetical protein [Pseudarthrobacter sp. C1]
MATKPGSLIETLRRQGYAVEEDGRSVLARGTAAPLIVKDAAELLCWFSFTKKVEELQ